MTRVDIISGWLLYKVDYACGVAMVDQVRTTGVRVEKLWILRENTCEKHNRLVQHLGTTGATLETT